MSKSPVQEASDSCSGSDKELSACPTCGDSFDTDLGVKMHHAKTHGESLVTSEYICDQCGESVKRMDDNVKGENIFCSVDCKAEWQSEHNTGSNHPRYKAEQHETRVCKHCGDEFEFYLGEEQSGRKNAGTYCSTECMDEWRSNNLRGDAHPLYKDNAVECANCGEQFQKKPAKAARHDKHFCNRSCHGEYISEHNTGENHPRWKGGHADYGESWYEARREALDRDGHRCQDCGTHRSNLDIAPHVHHITPVREFDDPNDAHDLDNLVTLCITCHAKWEGLYLRPDTRGEC